MYTVLFDMITACKRTHSKFTRQTICSLIHTSGLKIVKHSKFGWDGKGNIRDNSTSHLVHDFAHYLVSPPKLRCLPEFGLGASPDSGDPPFPSDLFVVNIDKSMREEEAASLLGIIIEWVIGMPSGLTWTDHGWEGHKNYRTVLHILARRRLIDDNAMPLIVPDRFRLRSWNK